MQHVEVVRHFDAPLEDVWRVYSDHAGWHRWAGFDRSWLERSGAANPNGRGALRGFASGPVKVFEEIVDFEPPRRMTYRVVRGGLPMKNHLGEVTLSEDGEGTRLVWKCRFESRWPIPGLAPLMRIFVERVFRTALVGLAKHGFDHRPDGP